MAQWFYRRRFLNFHYFLIISPWKMFGPSLNKLIYPSSRNALCQVWLKLAHWFWRRRFLNFVDVFSLFQNHLPLEKREALHLNKLIYPSPKEDLCQIKLKLAQWFWRRRFFKFINVFLLFHNHLPLHCAKFGWNWHSGSGEEDFSN